MNSIGDETDTAGNITGDLACPLQHCEWDVALEMETSWWQEGQKGHVLMPHGRSHEDRTVHNHALFFRPWGSSRGLKRSVDTVSGRLNRCQEWKIR